MEKKTEHMAENTEPIYKITVESFVYKNEIYNVALSPYLYWDEDGLDFTGDFVGLLIHPVKGTISMEFRPDGKGAWDVTPRGLDPNVIDEIEKIIKRIKNGTSKQY